MIVQELEKEIKAAHNWLKNATDIRLLYRQKRGIESLINIVDSKKKQLKNSLKERILELRRDGFLDDLGSEAEITELINDLSGKDSDNRIPTTKFLRNDWERIKLGKLPKDEINTSINELTVYINIFAKLLIELSDSPEKLSDNLQQDLARLFARIDKMQVMTLDEEANKLYKENWIVLIEKTDKPYSVCSVSGIKLICIEYKEDWEFFLQWALSHNNLCRNILHNSNSVSIIGKEDDVETVVALYENKRREILSRAC